ncbi:ADP-ribosylglycohydrolase family protein [Brachyspira aalborgi]|uniref:ADP-ribosylglycohydrolase n=1 Tax=Brachyspira aalborgi TaxID=29522 RepID=A0A5C8CJT7_9SPIR|nr:ADP-ribosylglycohydrolase family protein [Brachyspira aalborgi]TXJ13634.1 ADP-ribosylglycohydrolase [Brachyspira aalborgi]
MGLEKNISGAIAGMVLGDAMGMPGELWSKERIKKQLGHIEKFIDGPINNEVARYFKAGQFTDDSAQALLFLEAICEYNAIPDAKILASKLLKWVDNINGFEKNILGSSSKAALLAHKKNEDYIQYTSKAVTNGSAMRIAPIGCIIDGNNIKKMAIAVANISRVTHSSDVTIAGAAMIAQAVASALLHKNFDDIIKDVILIHDIAIKLGAPTYSASCKSRLQLAISLLKNCKNNDEVSQMVYDIIGTGVLASESIPTAITIAYYCRHPEKAAIMCANLGGDTDTIGAMSCAICGAYTGIDAIRSDWIKTLEKVNCISFSEYTDKILKIRKTFKLIT